MAIGKLLPRIAPPLRPPRIGRTGHSLPEAWPLERIELATIRL
jgi:hypothetical protein